MVSYIKGGMQAKGIWKQNAEANIWIQEGREWRVEKAPQWGTSLDFQVPWTMEWEVLKEPQQYANCITNEMKKLPRDQGVLKFHKSIIKN